MDSFDPPQPGLGPALGTVAAPVLGIAPTVTVTSPTAGMLVPSRTVAVTGTYTGPDHTGITVNGIVAYAQNGTFLAPDVGLDPQNPGIDVVATTLDGLTKTTSFSVQLPGAEPPVALLADADAGPAPFRIAFSARIDAGLAVKNVAIDYDGNGSTDYANADPDTIPPHDYATPGIYRAKVTITLNDNSVLMAERRVIVIDHAAWRDRLCRVYAHLRTQMAANQPDKALLAFAADVRPKYQSLFNAMGPQLPTAASHLGTLATGLIGPDQAYFTTLRETGTTVEGFPVMFAPDVDGVWRIRGM